MNEDICPYCDGSGERNPFSGERCLMCDGNGWIEEPELTDEERMSEQEHWDQFYDAGY